MNLGDKAALTRTVTEEDINRFAEVTGDNNYAHVDEEAAKKGPFGERIAHGMLSAGFISAVLGTKLPGPGTIYLSQNLKFLKPVKIGDNITATVEVVEVINEAKGIYKLNTLCSNGANELVLEGEAVVKYDEQYRFEPLKKEQKLNKKTSFYSEDELKDLGLKSYGSNVLISRNAVLYNPELLEIGHDVRIDDFTTISGKVSLGSYIHIAQFCGLYGGDEGIFMEDFTGLSSRVVIYATSNDYSGNSLTNPMVPAKYKQGDKSIAVRLEKHVIVGCTSVILPGVNIGIGSSVGAMSLVAKSLDPWGVYAGSPVKRLKDRSKKLLELEEEMLRDLEKEK